MICEILLTLTEKCNLKCKYCYEKNKHGSSMKLEVAKKIIARFLAESDYDMVNIVLFGGEPFLEFELIKDICEWTWGNKWKANYQFNFSTNGTVFNESIKEWLRNNADKIKLCLSADGGEETQNINRDNSFRKVDFELFKKLWIPPYVKMTIGQETLGNLSEDILFFHSKGFQFAECNLAEGILWRDEDATVFDRELRKMVKFYIEHEDIIPAPILGLELWKCSIQKREKRKCEMGRHIYAFDCEGNQCLCNFFTEMSFAEDELGRIKKAVAEDCSLTDVFCYEKCYYYPICKSCYGADYSIYGKFGRHNEGRCKMVKVQAYHAAVLQAGQIAHTDINSFNEEEKRKIGLTIKAINIILKGF